jgi:hypothetical protein
MLIEFAQGIDIHAFEEGDALVGVARGHEVELIPLHDRRNLLPAGFALEFLVFGALLALGALGILVVAFAGAGVAFAGLVSVTFLGTGLVLRHDWQGQGGEDTQGDCVFLHGFVVW